MTEKLNDDATKNSSTIKDGETMTDEVDIIGLAYEDARREGVQLKGGYLKAIAPAKVNLFLAVGQPREDGYHNVQNVMHTLLLHDTVYLRTVAAKDYEAETGQKVETSGINVHLTCSGGNFTALDIPQEKNLAYKAIMMLAKATNQTADQVVDIHIEKKIPTQAGLGGGSSDAAATLIAAAAAWGLPKDAPEIEACAQKLGADVAFFLRGGCALYSGVGEVFEQEFLPRKDAVLLVKPPVGCHTAEIYRAYDSNPCEPTQAELAQVSSAKSATELPFYNALQPTVEQLEPQVKEIIEWLGAHEGVTHAMLTGSGSCVYVLGEQSALNALHVEACKRGLWGAGTYLVNSRAAV